MPELVEGAAGEVLGDRNYWAPKLAADLAPADLPKPAPATAGITALGARILGLSWGEALLIGAVVSSTDAAAVYAAAWCRNTIPFPAFVSASKTLRRASSARTTRRK